MFHPTLFNAVHTKADPAYVFLLRGNEAQHKRDYTKAVEYYSKAADIGSTIAKFNLAALLHAGSGIQHDFSRAWKLCLEIINAPYRDETYAITLDFCGLQAFYGTGCPKDWNKAAEYYEKAAHAGFVRAWSHLGGVQQKLGLHLLALQSFQMGANKSDPYSILILAGFYGCGEPTLKIQPEKDKSFEYFNQINNKETLTEFLSSNAPDYIHYSDGLALRTLSKIYQKSNKEKEFNFLNNKLTRSTHNTEPPRTLSSTSWLSTLYSLLLTLLFLKFLFRLFAKPHSDETPSLASSNCAPKILPALTAQTILPSKIQLGTRLGAGGFGVVYKGRWTDGEAVDVAIKEIRSDLRFAPSMEKEFNKEAELMWRLTHRNLVTLYGLSTSPKRLIMEFCDLGSLWDVLHRTQLDWDTKQKIARQVTKGIAFLHANEVMHRDLKSLNILVTSGWVVKIADFGLSKWQEGFTPRADTTTTKGGSIGTPLWMAPELHCPGTKYAYACDVYSYGIILWEIATGREPSLDRSSMERELSKAQNVPVRYGALLKQCWDTRPSVRPTMAAALLEQEQLNLSA